VNRTLDVHSNESHRKSQERGLPILASRTPSAWIEKKGQPFGWPN